MNTSRLYKSLFFMMIVVTIFLFPLQTTYAQTGSDSVWDRMQKNENNKDESNTNESETKESKQEEKGINTNSKSVFILLLQLFFYTAIVLFMIYGLIKFLAKRQKTFQRNHLFEMVGGIPLGQHKSLQLVKVGEKMYLIGVGENINLLKEIDDREEIESYEKQLNETNDFPIANHLKTLWKKGQEKKEQKYEFSSFQQQLNQSIHTQKEKRALLEKRLLDQQLEEEEQS